MNRPIPLMYTVPAHAARLSDAWAQAHMELLAILLPPVPTPAAERYTAARDFCRQQAQQSPADAYDWHREADHWQAQLERVQPLQWEAVVVPADDADELPF